MFYCGANQKLQFYLAGVVTTNELSYVSTAINTSDTIASKHGTSNGVTAVDLCNTAAGLVRHFEIYNADTTDATIYVIYNDNGTTRIVHQEVIQSGYTLVYDSESGWAVTPSQSGLVSHAIDGAAHTVAGRTAGQVLRATSANTFGWSTATYPGTVESGTLLVATSTNAIGTLGVGLTTQVLVGGGAATVPSWSTDLPTALTIGGAYIYRAGGTDVAVADGGTGLSTLGTANQLLGVNNGATGLEYKSLLGTTNQITVTHAAGSITLALPQNIHTTATPTFGAINLGSATGAGTGDVKGSGVLQMAGTGTHCLMGSTGIGTTNPGGNLGGSFGKSLHIADSGNNYTTIQVQNTNNGTGAGAFFLQTNDTGQQLAFGTYGSGNTGSTLFGLPRAKNSFIFNQGITGATGFAIGTATPMDLTLGTNLTANVTIRNGGNVGILTATPTYALSFGGNSARTIWMERHTTANTAGNTLTVQAGGATVGATNKAGGGLLLKPGASTGNAESGVQIYGCVAGASGTADGTMSVMLQVLGDKIGFFGATPVAKQTGCAVPTDLESCITAITVLRTALNNYGLTTVV
jgi:hypothetical protein